MSIAGGIEGEVYAKEICDALGLKHVKRLVITMGHEEVFTVEAEMYMEIDGVKQLPAIIKHFELVPKVEIEDVSAMGDTTDHYQTKEVK